MPRARKAKLSDEFRMEMALKYHVIDAQISNADGVTNVKHEVYGWMPIDRLYMLQKLHDLMPLVQEFVRGGYQAKAWLWSANLSIAGFDLPLGGALPVLESVNFFSELFRQPIDPPMLALRAYALFGPWGDVIQIIDTMLAAVGVAEGLAGWWSQQQGATDFIGPIPIPPNPYQPPGTEPTLE